MRDDKDEDREAQDDSKHNKDRDDDKLPGRDENPEVVIVEAVLGGLVVQQREPVSWELDWRAYDVPRIWSILEAEDTEKASQMGMAFNLAAQYVRNASDDLTRAAGMLAEAWTGTEAADAANAQLREVIQAFQRDEEAHAAAAYDIDRIVNRIAETKTRVQPIMERWMGLADVAMDPTLGPMFTEIIDSEAKQADAEARNQMFQMEQDLSAQQVTSVPEYRPTSPPTLEQVQKTGLPVDQADLKTDMLYQPPPPLPGVAPVVGELTDSPRLAGIVPRAVAGGDGPGSMVPLSPGHPMAPNGGAYVLGSGTVVSRPTSTPAADAAASARPVGAGMMGMGGMIGGMGAPGGGAGGAAGSGKADTEWEIMRGVGPVIGLSQTAPPSKARGSLEDFDGWYAALAMPWKKTR
ncbi:hypothetical protein [Allorhizocola rhizosphaerae]|uniref:hypothetical protein n=1 Tax=Allorhizocola rhizosphaerae TaxID=1872709 RepID=UPI000E3B8A94|nr:hypothetical protein [Allorhizocola rhizosphaerae]